VLDISNLKLACDLHLPGENAGRAGENAGKCWQMQANAGKRRLIGHRVTYYCFSLQA